MLQIRTRVEFDLAVGQEAVIQTLQLSIDHRRAR